MPCSTGSGETTRLRLALLRRHGAILFAMGKVDELLASQKQSVELSEQLAGPNDLDTVNAIVNLGVAYNVHGDFADALGQFRSARAAYTKLMGSDYVQLGLVDDDEADLLVQQGHPAQAIPLAEHAIKTLLATRGPNHGDTIDAQNTYGEALLQSGDVRRALALFDEHEPSWSKMLDPNSGDAGNIADTRASINRASGNPTKATDVLESAIATRGAADPQLAVLLTHLAQCDLDRRRPGDALDALERAVRIGTERQLAPTKLATAKFELARVLVATGGDAKRAHTLASEALAVFEHAEMTRAAEVKAWLAAN